MISSEEVTDMITFKQLEYFYEAAQLEHFGSLTLNKREIPTGLEKPVFFCQIFQN
jgi:hypothetical protein